MNMIFSAALQFGGPLGQFDPVHARHHDIGQQKVEGEALDAVPGVAAIAEIGDGMAGLDQRRRKELAQGFVVFRQKDMRHSCPPARSPIKPIQGKAVNVVNADSLPAPPAAVRP